MSETTSVGTIPDINTPKGSVGKPQCFTTIGIFNEQTLMPVECGEKGEICFMGPTVCDGYYDAPSTTAELLQKHPDGNVWLHSGDIGYMDKDGYIYFCERKKRMYVRFDGTKVSPHSIETVILRHPDVEHCLIVPINDTDHTHGMCAKAMIVLRKGANKKTAKVGIQKYMHKNLGEHMMPKQVEIVEKLPYTKSGKLDCFSQQKAV